MEKAHTLPQANTLSWIRFDENGLLKVELAEPLESIAPNRRLYSNAMARC